MLTIIACKVGEPPAVQQLAKGLSAMQGFVGGCIECLCLGGGVDLWCNDEGRGTLKLNRIVVSEHGDYHEIYGDFFLASSDNKGSTISIKDAAIPKYLTLMEHYRVCPGCRRSANGNHTACKTTSDLDKDNHV